MNEGLVSKIEDKIRVREETDVHSVQLIIPSGIRGPDDTASQIRRQTVEPRRRSGLAFLLCVCGVLKAVDHKGSKCFFKHPVATFWERLWRRKPGT